MSTKKSLNVLIIDDHPQISQSFIMALNKIESESDKYEFIIKEATSLDIAHNLIIEVTNITFDLIFLDIKLPPSKDGKYLSGEDLGITIREHSSDSKIIVATTYNDNFRINNILKSINPEGLLIKNDLQSRVLINAIEDVLDNIPTYSKTVKSFLQKLVSSDITLDQLDRQIIYHLSVGGRTVELPSILPMSIAGVERRKRHIKEAFGISGQDDRALVKIAREKGFI